MVSLYTNIPVRKTIDIICNKFFSQEAGFHGFSRKDFRTLLSLACENPLFLFNDAPYTHIGGAQMGSLVSAALANMFLCHHNQVWLENYPQHLRPDTYFRYMDDTFTVLRNEDKAYRFLDYLNSRHPNIKFTKESEKNGSLPFLDIRVSKDRNDRIHTTIYRKVTFTRLTTSFYSNICEKFNAVRTLLRRAYFLSSDHTFFHAEVTFLEKLFT